MKILVTVYEDGSISVMGTNRENLTVAVIDERKIADGETPIILFNHYDNKEHVSAIALFRDGEACDHFYGFDAQSDGIADKLKAIRF